MGYGEKPNIEHPAKDSNADVVFHEYRAKRFTPASPRIVQWVLVHSGGYVKDETRAMYILIGFAAIVITISLFLFFAGGGNKAKFEAPPGQKIIYPEDEPPRLQDNF